MRPTARLTGRDDRNLTVRSQTAFELSTRLGYEIAADDLVTLVIERDPQGGARIRPAQPFSPGEYGFLVMAAGRVGYFPQWGPAAAGGVGYPLAGARSPRHPPPRGLRARNRITGQG